MKRICAWCGKGLGEVEPLDDSSVTHGICPDCSSKLKEKDMNYLLRGGGVMSDKVIISCKKCGRDMAVPICMLEPHTRNERQFGRQVWCGWCDATKYYMIGEVKPC